MTTKIVSVSSTVSKIQVNDQDSFSFDSSGNLNLTSVNGGQLAGLRNRIINGKMDIAQRGTSFAGIAPNVYCLDRWAVANSATTTAVLTASQQADVPSSNEFQNSLRIAVTTADASITAGKFIALRQRIEGYNVRDLIGKTFTLSFWVRSSKTGTHCVSLANVAADRSYVAEYTVSAANTWEQKSITVSGGLITAGTWDWTTGNGLAVAWSLAAGSTYQTTGNAWQTGGFFATANQVNCLDTIGNIFAITGVQLEVGSVATPFEHRPYGMELALCQRYLPLFSDIKCIGYGTGGGAGYFTVPFPVKTRVAPTGITASAPGAYSMFGGLGVVTVTGIAFNSASDLAGTLTINGAFTAGQAYALTNGPVQFTGCEL